MSQALDELGKTLDKLEREYSKQLEEEIISRGCHRCGGEIGEGSNRRSIALTGPCSVGSMMQTFYLCFKCNSELYDFLSEVKP